MSAIVDPAQRIPANLSAAETLAFRRQRNARALERETAPANNPEVQDTPAKDSPPEDSTPPVPGQLLTEAQVCQRLGIGQRSLQRLISRGEVKAIKMTPKLVRIHPAEVERYLATRITSGGNPAPGASAALPASALPEGTVRLDPEAWYNERVLRILGVAEKTLRDAVKTGALRCRDLGRGKRLFKGAWLQAWLEGPAGD